MSEEDFTPLCPWENYVAYRAAVVLPEDRQGRVLMQLRDYHPRAVNPGLWGFFGGEVEAGETMREAAAREFFEETGLALAEEVFTPLCRYISPVHRGRLYVFHTKISAGPPDIRLGEGAGFGFIDPRGFEGMRMSPFMPEVLAHWRAARG